jgi:DNA-directed RNA polymerase I subunit RPA1
MHMQLDFNAKCSISGLAFEFYNTNDIKRLSVKEITNPQALDRLLNPVQNGLYDLALGPLDKNDVCLTCNLDYFKCPGHFGHINLVLPVYNPIFFRELIKLLRVSCLSCHQLITSKLEKECFYAKMFIINLGLIEYLNQIDDLYTKIVNENDSKLINKMSFKKYFDELIESILKENNIDIENNESYINSQKNSVRNVVKSKIDLVREFMNSKLKASKQTCPNCHLPMRQLRAEHNSKLFYAKGVSARQIKKNQQKKLSVKYTLGEIQNEQETEQLVDELNELDLKLENEDSSDEIAQLKKKIDKNNLKLSNKQNEMMEEMDKLDSLSCQSYLTPVETRKHLQLLIENEKDIILYLFGKQKETYDINDLTGLFFFDSLAVPPSKYRPISQFKEQKFENAQTAQFSKLIQQNHLLSDLLNEMKNAVLNGDKNETDDLNKLGKKAPLSLQEKLQASWLQLQTIVNVLYDSELDKLNVEGPAGLKQLLEKKEGLFRKHMMGKRVNYAGRSVISPDVYINTDEIGIPEIFAKKLTYPQPVNSINFWEMRQLVLNGPDVYPGACLVEYGNGNIVRLKGKDYESRLAIAKQLLTPESAIDSNLDIKIVHRHLKNGDVLLFNRQPTLHRPSVMSHKARVLPNEKTLRMHYSNCKSYNADFDGDEMNAHLPQNEIARSEALNLMLSSEHYLVPKDGTPLGGLIHDHVVSGTALTMRDRFFDKADYQHLVYNSFNTHIRGNIKLLPPAIIKPRLLWTGKQVVSTLLINLLPEHKGALNLESKAKISEKIWYRETKSREPNWTNDVRHPKSYNPGQYMNESYVLIRQGNLLSGVLDKAHYGSSSFSLVHCCYELYGGDIAGQLLTCLGRLFTAYIQFRGFTLGVEDILLKDEVKKPMSKIIKKSKKCGYDVLAQVFQSISVEDQKSLTEQYQRKHLNPDDSFMKEIDLAYKGSVDSFQNSLTNLCFPNGLIKKFPNNNLQLMIQSGAKGSSVNSMQMSVLLGQQELEGRRPRLMANGNTLPSFLPYDPSPSSGGFITNSFMTGLTPQEYFFHCMAGREGLVDTAVKTSRSGYLQRCLIKHLEGIVVNYDMTVRDSDNSVIQFQYGEDSLSVEKTQFLNEKQFPFLIDNYSIITSNRDEIERIRQICHHDVIMKKIEKIKEWKHEFTANKCDDIGYRWGPFLNYSKLIAQEEHVKNMPFEERVKYINDKWNEMNKDEKKIYKKGKFKRRLPITTSYNPDRYLGATSEKLEDFIDNFINKYESKFSDDLKYKNWSSESFNLDKNKFRELIYLKSVKSCITPGDSVGILAAQSIGEPSTQMTLNTFHFAGRGDMNVTLGIPRLREILMVASANIKTPSMKVPVFDSKLTQAELLKSHFTRTLLWDCIHKIDIDQVLDLNNENGLKKVWLTKVKFHFLTPEDIKNKIHTDIKLSELIHFVEVKFIKNLCISINKKYNQISSTSLLHASTVRDKSMKNFQNINEGINNDGDGENDNNDEIDDDVIDSGESMGEKLLNKIDDELEYEGEEEEKDELNESNESSSSEGEDDKEDKDNDNQNDDEETKIELAEINSPEKIKKKLSKKIDAHRVNRILNISDMISDYTYDPVNLRWFEITFKLDALKPRLDLYTVIQKEAKSSYIARVEGIKRCFLNQSTLPEDHGCYNMITEGINVNEVIKHSNVLNVSKLYLNDIHQMASKFGVEAAAKVIINEMKSVFGAYGINVDYRHLSLIADYMTFEGVYKPFNRIGIKSNSSPLQKMSFETCLQFFKDACLYGIISYKNPI